MTPRSKRPRAQRREQSRKARKLAEQREKLFRLEPGGSPERPISIGSAAVIELKAAAIACPTCDGQQQVLEHLARTIGSRRLREVRLECRYCGSTRSVWYRLEPASLH